MTELTWSSKRLRTETKTSVLRLAPTGGQPLVDDAPRPLPRYVGGRYEVVRELAHGAMGCVLLVRDPQGAGLLALKQPLSRELEQPDLFRMHREAEVTHSLDHPNVVRAREFDVDDDGLPFLVLDYVKGETLRQAIDALREGAPGSARSFVWRAKAVLQLARALQHAHERDVIHRDVKPDNAVVTPDGRAVLIDWGLAKRGAQAAASGRLKTRGRIRGNASRSAANTVAGTPAYMAPEALRGAIGPGTDVFSLSALLYELLTLEHYLPEAPHSDFHELALQVSEVVPVPADRVRVPGQAPVPPALARICARGLHKDPKQRYASAAELAEDLEQWLSEQEAGGWPSRLRAAAPELLAAGLAVAGVMGAAALCL